MTQIEKTLKAFGGTVYKLSHESTTVRTTMKLNVFLPPNSKNAPILFYLAGLTCSGDNGLEKGGFLGPAAHYGIALVFPDTSPRTKDELIGADGLGEHSGWDFGSGAGFYINATNKPWSNNYHMEDYIVKELPQLLSQEFPDLDHSKIGLMGHSMGGHGAVTLYLKHHHFVSCSAFAPISNPTQCAWGHKAFSNYLGSIEAGKEYDASELIKKGARNGAVLVDQGTDDQFLKDGQLQPDSLVIADSKVNVELRKHDGYDHSYFFISTFAEDHIAWHAKHYKNTQNTKWK